MKTKEREAKEVQHYYAGQKKGYWWKYLLAALIVFIYLIPLYVLVLQSFKGDSDPSSPLGPPEVFLVEK